MRFFVFVCVCVCVAYSAFHFLFPFVSLTLAPIQRIEAFMQNAAGVVVKIKTGRIFIFTLQHRHINGNLIVRLNKWNYVEWITLKFRLHYHSRPLLPHKVKPRTMCAKIYIYMYTQRIPRGEVRWTANQIGWHVQLKPAFKQNATPKASATKLALNMWLSIDLNAVNNLNTDNFSVCISNSWDEIDTQTMLIRSVASVTERVSNFGRLPKQFCISIGNKHSSIGIQKNSHVSMWCMHVCVCGGGGGFRLYIRASPSLFLLHANLIQQFDFSAEPISRSARVYCAIQTIPNQWYHFQTADSKLFNSEKLHAVQKAIQFV